MLLSDVCLSDVCLSVAYIGPKSRTERPMKTKIITEVATVTRDSDTTFKVKRSKVKVTRPIYSPPCWRVRQLQRWAWERVGREKVLLRCRLLGSARRFGAHGEESGGDISWRPPAYSLFLLFFWCRVKLKKSWIFTDTKPNTNKIPNPKCRRRKSILGKPSRFRRSSFRKTLWTYTLYVRYLA